MDFTFVNHGSICILTPVSPEGLAWRDENLPEGALAWGGNGVVIEPRFAGMILDGIAGDGLTVGGM